MTDHGTTTNEPPEGMELATFGGGCFWCMEAVFVELRGVGAVVSGYAGGDAAEPSYEQVCAGATGHAEVIQVTFDPRMVSYDELLEVFFAFHDPTTPNRQGVDVGTQYRSIVLSHDAGQRAAAEATIARLDADGTFPAPIATEVADLDRFWPAEDGHQAFYARNGRWHPYCVATITPKVARLRRAYANKLRAR